MASVEEKFNAAVQAIRKLPKDGPFQPSYDMMKKFYGLYKQATEGPCNESRPAFWNAIKKAKWEAWSCLGDMSKVKAQEEYVNEMLKIMVVNFKAKDVNHMVQIIEAMPQTEEVRNFLRIMGPFFEAVTVKDAEEKTPDRGIPNGKVVHAVNGDRGDGPNLNGVDNELIQDEKVKSDAASLLAMAHRDSLTINQLANGHIKKHDLEIPDSIEESHTADNTTGLSDSSHPIYVNEEDQTNNSHDGDASSSSGTEDEFCDSIDQPDVSMERKVRFAASEPLQVVGEDQPLTSTPMVGDTITTEAEVHSVPGSRPNHRTNQSGNTSGMTNGHTDSVHSLEKSSSIRTTPRVRRNVTLQTPVTDPTGGTGAGNRSKGRTPSSPEEMSEHIALVLERLQRDMNSVLVRLNTLETLAVTRHQMDSQGPDSPNRDVKDKKDTWWLFSRLDMKTVFFILVWPFVVSWVIKFLSRRRRFMRE